MSVFERELERFREDADPETTAFYEKLIEAGAPVDDDVPPPTDDDVPPELRPTRPEQGGAVEQLHAKILHGDAIEHLPPRQPLVAGWLNLDSLAVLFGRPGTGKSFVALDFGEHVATGSWWYGHEVTPGDVLYVAAEGAAGMGPRQAAWRAHNRLYQPSERMHWLPRAVNLLDPVEAQALAYVASDLNASFVVIDTLARSMPGGDENSSRDMGTVIAAADTIRTHTGACVLLVHHSGKDSTQGARGHSSLLGAVDTELEVKAGGDGIVTLANTKQKDGPEQPPFRLVLVAAADSVAVARYTGHTPDQALGAKAQAALDALAAMDVPGGVTATQWQKVSLQNGVPESTFYVQRRTLLEANLVQQRGEGREARYSLPTRENP